jgi:hypothetical protein
MVKNVEKFRPEINPHPFSAGQYKVFDQCEVRVDEIRTVVEVNPRFTQSSWTDLKLRALRGSYRRRMPNLLPERPASRIRKWRYHRAE